MRLSPPLYSQITPAKINNIAPNTHFGENDIDEDELARWIVENQRLEKRGAPGQRIGSRKMPIHSAQPQGSSAEAGSDLSAERAKIIRLLQSKAEGSS